MTSAKGSKSSMSLSSSVFWLWGKRTLAASLAVVLSATLLVVNNAFGNVDDPVNATSQELSQDAETGNQILPGNTPVATATFYDEDETQLVADKSLTQNEQDSRNNSWNQRLVSGDKIIKPALPPVKNNYIFDHWALKPDSLNSSTGTPGGSSTSPANGQNDSWKDQAYDFDTVQKFSEYNKQFKLYAVYRHAYVINFIIRSDDLDEVSAKDVVIASYTESRFCKPDDGTFKNDQDDANSGATSAASSGSSSGSSSSTSSSGSAADDDYARSINSCKFVDYEKYVRPFLSSGKYVAGWTASRDDKDTYVEADTPILENSNFYVTIKRGFELSFDSRGGDNVETTYGSPTKNPAKPKDPEREGYSFKGWSSSKDSYDPYNFDQPLNEHKVVYAFWTPRETSITIATKIEDTLDKQGNPLPLSYDVFALKGLTEKVSCTDRDDCASKGGHLVLTNSSANPDIPAEGIKDDGATAADFAAAIAKTKEAAAKRTGTYVLQNVGYKEHLPNKTEHFIAGQKLTEDEVSSLKDYCAVPPDLEPLVDRIIEAPESQSYTKNGLAGDGSTVFTCKLKRKRLPFTYYYNTPSAGANEREKLYAIRFYDMLLGDNNQFPGEDLYSASRVGHKFLRPFLEKSKVGRRFYYAFTVQESQSNKVSPIDLYNTTDVKRTNIAYLYPPTFSRDNGQDIDVTDFEANNTSLASVNIIASARRANFLFVFTPFEVGKKYLLNKGSESFNSTDLPDPSKPQSELSPYEKNILKYHKQAWDSAACLSGGCDNYDVFTKGSALFDNTVIDLVASGTITTIQDHYPIRGFKQYFLPEEVYFKGGSGGKYGPSCKDSECREFVRLSSSYNLGGTGREYLFPNPDDSQAVRRQNLPAYKPLDDKVDAFFKTLDLDYRNDPVVKKHFSATYRNSQNTFPYKRLSYRLYFNTHSNLGDYDTLVPYNFGEKEVIKADYDLADDDAELQKAKGVKEYLKKFVVGKTVRAEDGAVFVGWSALRDDESAPHNFGDDESWHMPAFDSVIVAIWEKPKYRLRVFCQAKSDKICFQKDYTVGTVVNKDVYDDLKRPADNLTDATQSEFIQWLWRRAPRLGFDGEKVIGSSSRPGSWRRLDVNGDIIMNSNVDVRPQYRLEQLTIRYHPGLVNFETGEVQGPQGTGTMSQDLLYKPNTYPKIKDNAFTAPEGYYFVGWKVKDVNSQTDPRDKMPGDFVHTQTTGMNTEGVVVSADVYAMWAKISTTSVRYHASYPHELVTADADNAGSSNPANAVEYTSHQMGDEKGESFLRNDVHRLQQPQEDWKNYAWLNGYRFVGWADHPSAQESEDLTESDVKYLPYVAPECATESDNAETQPAGNPDGTNQPCQDSPLSNATMKTILNDRHHNDLYAVWKHTISFFIKKVSYDPLGQGQEKLLDGADFKITQGSTLDNAVSKVELEEKSTSGSSDWKDSAQFLVQLPDSGSYDIVETKAPFGHSLIAQPISIAVDAQGNVSLVDKSTGSLVSARVYRAKVRSKAHPDKEIMASIVQITDYPASALPLAGSIGVWVYLLIGVMAMSVGVAAQYMNKRSSLPKQEHYSGK